MAVPVLLVLLVVGLLLVPSVQRAVAARVLGGAVPGEVALESLKLRPGSLHARGLVLGLGAGHLQVEEATVYFTLGSLLRGAPEIADVRVTGLVFDLTRPDPSHVAKPIKGVVGEIPPAAFSLANADLRGRLILAADRSLDFHLVGGGYSPTSPGQFNLQADVTGAAPANARLSLTLTPDAAGAVGTVTIFGPLTAQVDEASVSLDLDASFQREATEEVMNLSLRQGSAAPLLQTTASFGTTTPTLGGTFTLAVAENDVSLLASLLGQAWPTAHAEGTGRFDINLESGAAAGELKLTAAGSAWERASAGLTAMPPVTLTADLAFSLAQGILDLPRLVVDLAAPSHPFAAHLELFQPIRWDPAQGPAGLPAGQLLDLTLEHLPLAWLAPGQADGEVAAVGLRLAVEDGELRLANTTPLRFTLATWSDAAGTVLLRDLTLSATPALRFSQTTRSIDIADLRLADETGASLAHVRVQAASEGADLLANWTWQLGGGVSLERLAAQPVGAALTPLNESDLGLSWTANGRFGNHTLDLAAAGLELSPGNTRTPVLTGALAGPRRLALADPMAGLTAPGPLATLTWNDFPLLLANPFLPTGTDITNGKMTGTLQIATSAGGRFDVTAPIPLHLERVSARDSGGPLVENLGLTFAPAFSTDLTHHQLLPVELAWTLGGSAWMLQTLAAEVSATTYTMKTKVIGSLDLADRLAWARRQEDPWQSGALALELAVNGSLTDTTVLPQATASLELREVVLASGANLPRIEATFALASAGTPGADRATARLALVAGSRTSDVLVEADLVSRAQAWTLAGRLTSQLLHLPDLQAWQQALALVDGVATEPPPAPAPGAPAAPADRPFWAPWTGTFTGALQRVELSPRSSVTAVRLAANVTEQAITLEEFSGRLGDRPVTLRSTVDFDAARAEHYALRGDLTVDQLNLASLIPPTGDQRPFLEGIVQVDGTFTSASSDATELFTGLRFNVHGQGSAGKIRLVSGAAQADPRAALAGAIGSGLSGLLGGRSGGASSAAGVLPKLLALFQEMSYDTFEFRAQRSDGPVELSLFELKAEDIRLASSARFDWTPGLPLAQQTFELPVRLAVRGRSAYLLDQAALLTGQQLGDGWYIGPTFVQGGSMGAPSSNLREIFGRAVVGSLTGRRLGLADPDAPAPTPAPATEPANPPL